MKRSVSSARPLIVLALVTILFTNSIAFSAYAGGRPATATPTLAPDPPANGMIAFARVDTDYTVNGIYLINPDGSGEGRIPFTEFDSTPVWSPNGMRLAVVHLANQHSGAVSGFGVEIMNADGSGRVRLNDNMEPGERIAWSPDGTKIAFTSWSQFGPNADIMVMDADTGSNIVNLTNDPSYDYLPSWSPDGTKIIFTSNRSGNLDVFVMNADGSNQQNITNYFANDYYPSWSPDGSKIVFVSSGRGGTFDNDEICVMNADGSNVVNLTVNQVADLMPAWSPDGTKIVFNSDRNGNRDLYSMNADGSNETRVTVHTAEDSRASWQLLPVSTPTPTPTPSPTPRLNGNIAFTRVGPPAEQIATINEDGSNLTVLTSGSNAEDPEFSPDGTRIAFSSVNSGQFQIWLMNSDGSGQTRLTNNNLRGDDEPTWSPDGSKIAFVGGAQIWVINADGTNEINLSGARTGDNYPDWSPDGSKIAFTKDYSSPNAQTFVMNADGSNLVNLSNTVVYGAERDPAWSPDGSKIAYQSLQDGPYEIYVMNADGSGETRLTATGYPVSNTEPDWSPDGSKIVFSSTRDNDEQEIYVMNADGTGQTRLTNDPVKDEHPSWGSYVAAPPTPTPTPQADLAATADAQPYQVEPGGALVFNNAVTNNGPSLANNVNVDVYVPPYTQLDSYNAPGGTCQTTTYPNDAGHQVLCSFGDLGAGEVRSVTVNVTITAIDGASMQAINTVSSSTDDPFSGNNTAYAPLIVRAAPTPTPTPTPEPGGTRIAFVSERDGNQEIYVMNADGSGQTNISNNAIPSWSADTDPAWSPDGSKIAFQSNRDAYSGLYVMNADGTNVVAIPGVGGTSPAWSPDGSQLAFVSNLEIYKVNPDGTNLTRLTDNAFNDTKPSWSPDGSYLAFETWRDGGSEIYVMGQDGGNPTRLTNTPGIGAYDPAWSPNGLRIAYHSFNVNNFDIFTMDAQGGLNQMRITSDVAEDFGAAWSPDGSKILFTSDRDGNQEIYACDWDGANPTRLTNVAPRDYAPACQIISTQADLAATASAEPYEVAPGGTLVFNSGVTNNGPAQAGDVAIEVIVPPDLAINNIDAPGATCTTTPDLQGLGYRVVCSFGNVASGEVKTLAINVTVNAIDGTGMQAITIVSSSSPDPDSNNNVAYAPAIVRVPTPPAANLVTSSGLDLLAANGATVTHNLFTFNNGPDAAANVTYTIQLPPGATYDTATNPYGSCAASAPDAQGTLVTCTLGDIPAYESRFISHTATVTGAPYEVLTFTSTVVSDTSDPYLDSNVVSVSVQIEGPPVPTPTPATGANPLIAFETRRDGNSEIYSRRADGSAQVNLTNDPADDADFVWSPDGSKLAFSRLIDDGGNNRDLFVMNADGSNLVRLTNSTDDQDSGAVWSPDGTKLLFTSQSNVGNTRALWVTNADGGNQIRIGVAAYDYDNDPSWSPDGTKIAYARDYYDGMNPSERNIYTANADGSNRTRIANAAGESDFTPTWSADGTKIYFVREVGGAVDIHDMDVDGSNQRNLSNIQTVFAYPAPSRSADRSQVAFIAGDFANPTVYVMNADGSSRVSVFNTTDNVATLGWSPDGTKMVVGTTFNVGLGAGIHVVNADGSGSLHFGGDAEYNQDPDWSPDGTRIVFTTRRTGNGGIDIINADGTGRVDLTNDPAYYTHPKWQPAAQGNTPAGTNVTVAENGATVTFSNVTQAGQTTITPIDPNSLQGIPGEYVINANSLAFEITTTATYTGPITIGFQVPGVNNPITFSTLRVLHGEPPPVPNFVDRTILAPDSPTHDFPARTIYARVTSLSPFVIAEKPPNQLTALGPAQVWIGLKNSDDVGTRFDLLAEVFKNGSLIGSGQVNNVAGGSSGFNNAKLNAINLALSGTPSFGAGSALSIRLSVRVTASGGHRSGTARLWFNDAAANSRFSATIGGVTKNYYLRKLSNSLVLTTATGSTPKVTIDVFVDRAVGGNPFKPFGTWAIAF